MGRTLFGFTRRIMQRSGDRKTRCHYTIPMSASGRTMPSSFPFEPGNDRWAEITAGSEKGTCSDLCETFPPSAGRKGRRQCHINITTYASHYMPLPKGMRKHLSHMETSTLGHFFNGLYSCKTPLLHLAIHYSCLPLELAEGGTLFPGR